MYRKPDGRGRGWTEALPDEVQGELSDLHDFRSDWLGRGRLRRSAPSPPARPRPPPDRQPEGQRRPPSRRSSRQTVLVETVIAAGSLPAPRAQPVPAPFAPERDTTAQA